MFDTRKHFCFEIFMYKLILYVRGIEIFIKTSTENVNKIGESSLPVLDIPFILAAAHLAVFSQFYSTV